MSIYTKQLALTINKIIDKEYSRFSCLEPTKNQRKTQGEKKRKIGNSPNDQQSVSRQHAVYFYFYPQRGKKAYASKTSKFIFFTQQIVII